MDITIKNIAHLDSKKIYSLISSNIGCIQKSFEYLNIDEDKYLRFVTKIIETTKKKYTGDITYIDFISREIKEALYNIIKKRLKNENTSFNLINNYINQNNNIVHSINMALRFFERLNDFFKNFKYVPTIDIIIRLFKENQIFKNATEIIFNSYKTQIMTGKSEEMFDNDLLVSTIYGYSLVNNINIEEDFSYQLLDTKGNDIIHDYLNEIGKKPLLSAEEERLIAQKVANGDELAKNKLVEHNLRLVVNIATSIIRKVQKLDELKLLDLIQEGNMGLMVAAERFDVERGYKFSTYATWWIKQRIYRAINNKERSIRIPTSIQERIALYNKTVEELRYKLLREPKLEEIAYNMGISTTKLRELYKVPTVITSINRTINEDDETEIGDFIPSEEKTVEEKMMANKLSEEVIELFHKCNLTQREIDILLLFYGFKNNNPQSAEAISKIYNCTRERIRQIVAKSIKKIRKSPYIKDFSIYMDFPEQAEKYIDEIRKKYIENPSSTKAYFKLSENKKENRKVRTAESIYELLKEYTIEQIDEMLTRLTKDEINLLKLRYGDNLLSLQSTKLSDEQNYRFYGLLLPKMKRILSKINRDNAKKIESLKKEPANIKTEFNKSQTVVTEKYSQKTMVDIEVFLNQNDIKIADSNKILKLLRILTTNNILNLLTVKEIVIIALRFGFIDGDFYSISSIANILGSDENEVIEIIKKVLLFYKANISEFQEILIKTDIEEKQKPKTLVLGCKLKVDGDL